MIAHSSPISGISTFAQKYIATAGYDNKVILWDAEKRNAIAQVFHDHLSNQCDFSSDGKFLVTSSSDYSARLWSVPDLKLLAVYNDQKDDVEMAALSPDNLYVATASRDKFIRVYERSGRLVSVCKGHTADVISVVWSGPDELISSSDDGTVRRWNARYGRETEQVDLGGIETDTIVFSPDGRIFAGNDEGNIITIERSGERKTTKAHDAGIKRLKFHAETKRLLSLSYDRKFVLWDALHSDLYPIASSDLPPTVWPRSCDFLSDDQIVFGSFGSSYAEFSLKTQRWTLDHIEPTPGFNAVTLFENKIYTVGDAGKVMSQGKEMSKLPTLCNFLLPVGGFILTGGQTGEVFDALTGKLIYRHHSPLNCSAAKKTGKNKFRAFVGTYTGELIAFDIEEHKVTNTFVKSVHPNAIKGVAVSEKEVFSVSATASAAWNDIETLEEIELKNQAHDKIANGCCFIVDGTFASISRDLKLRVWNKHAVKEYKTPHTHSIKCIAASNCGRFIALGSYNGRVTLFDMNSETFVKDVRPTQAGISSITFDGTQFVASSYDGQLYEVIINHA